ncbi:VapE domain-containing protein [Flavobacterium oreochromis]|uniref:Virulence-associated e family protein n=1 Tax=Flavobacterium columnare TaxID=996 RepID=A0A246G7T7_9FLAO|nr:VapE domain-containing protein [Flavobacterium oreochromis]OWP74652.1 virulence-associated e family protein [Flavobacterium oreochromis]
MKETISDNFTKCVELTQQQFQFIDEQKENYVIVLATLCNKYAIPIDKAKISIKEKYNFNDELVTKIINTAYSDKKMYGVALKKSIEDFLKEKYLFRYNEVLGKIEYKSHKQSKYLPMDDYKLNSICRDLEKAEYKITNAKLYNLLVSDFVPKYNPFKDYFENLPKWDGKDYIIEFSQLIITDDTVSWQDALKRWLVAMVACSVNENSINHAVIVLSGGQGIGKSKFINRILPPELKEYKYLGTINPYNKDSLILLSEKMLIDLDELGSLNRKDEKAMKELITKTEVQLRKPYGKMLELLPRRASFVGSVNDGEFLMDMTGNRRFLCFEVSKIDNDSKINYRGIYSQAFHLCKTGFKYWFDGDEIKLIDSRNEKFRAKNPIEELILAQYQNCTEDLADDFLSATDIINRLKEKHNTINLDTTSSMTVGKIMKKYNFKQTKKNDIYKYAVKNR